MDRHLLTLALGMFAIGTDSFVVAGILPLIADSMHAPIPTAGQMVTLYALSYAVFSPVIAALAAHWSRKGLLVGGMGVFILGNMMTALAPTLSVLLGSRLITGLGAAMFSPTATAVG
ncbi:MAG: MFS transporter, partial [Castellaniella sp.]